jgi:type II secretory pathway pseudopilin PulG
MESAQAPAGPPDPPVPPPTPKVSGWALSSLITSVFCVPLVPVVLGIVALNKISKSGGRLSGMGLAVTGLVLGLCQVVLIPALAGLAVPVILKQRKKAEMSVALNNLKQIGTALMEFETEYGSFPSRQIYQNNTDKFRNATGGDSANDLLGLLVAGGIVDSEDIFYAKGGSRFFKRPDNVFNTPGTLLEPGECGFGYVMLKGGIPLATSMNNSGCPVVVAPLVPGSGEADPEFHTKPYDGRAVYLRIDQAVKNAPIDESGKVRVPGSRFTLFETGPDTVWGDDVPDVHPPE